MSATLQQSRTVRIPASSFGAYTVAILHRGRWHETHLTGDFESLLDTAAAAHRRSGLVVQLRDDDGTILFEAGPDSDA